ncbi:TerB family tellurite resistance protein [Cellulophaga sp. E16_2]|uniref:TerB family tellurite resistance protein n=1 Tax=unclassified Cellulophaga TaxID=2634405 RepID=UPI0013FDEF0E|nr:MULTISPECIES: TerB family tellurite resistance protein [unclassified Cellulophaga]MBO0591149.1 TerB family tellurite resistance protein [Cellulophaga sp. E16_2]
MKSLEQLKKEIVADGIIDASEVKEIEQVIYADGTIDKEEADFLFDLNDAVSGNDNHSSWKELFVKAISSFVLDDDGSNGEIDADEAKYLVSQIEGDGQIDAVEKALLVHLKSTLGSSLPESLNNLIK